MEISRYIMNGTPTIEIQGQQGRVLVSLQGAGRSPSYAWFRRGSWEQEQVLLDSVQHTHNSDLIEPFKDLLAKAFEIARLWKYNSAYYYSFLEKQESWMLSYA